jgi:aspartate 4-decarboxylase
LEIPVLNDYQLEVVDIRMDEHADWQLPVTEIAKLLDPAIKVFCIVNPSNPPSTKLSDAVLDQLAVLVATQRPNLFIVTDDVYGTFVDDFVSLFAKCPRNALCVYSFSKFFGATGWRLGVIALHDDNVFDAALAALPEKQKLILDTRYASLTTQPRALRFIDRMVADSRAVALNHTAGLSVPQQLQMALFALSGLMDREHRYKDAAKQLIRQRYKTLYSNMGIKAVHEPNDANYYTLIDLQEIGGKLYGPEFEAWFIKSDLGIGFLFRLAKETGVVLLPGNGFEVVDTSARVSLANLTDSEYAAIGRFTRQVLDEYYQDFQKSRVDKK